MQAVPMRAGHLLNVLAAQRWVLHKDIWPMLIMTITNRTAEYHSDIDGRGFCQSGLA